MVGNKFEISGDIQEKFRLSFKNDKMTQDFYNINVFLKMRFKSRKILGLKI